MNNKTVNSLWIGKTLSLLEQLTLASFVQNGHEFVLWTYDEIESNIPAGVTLMDANKIIPREQVFAYKNTNQFGHGKGSVSGFSDIFRYKLLFDNGGWWVDMDITCIKYLDFKYEYFFRKHHELLAVGNVMKAPKGSELMKKCFEVAIEKVDANNTDWHKPIEILNEGIKELNLENFISGGHSNRDWWNEVKRFFYGQASIPKNWYFIHWTNENFRANGVDKNDFKIWSTYFELLSEYHLVKDNFTLIEKLKNWWKFFGK